MINYANEDELYFDNSCDECLEYACTLDDIRGNMEAVVSILFGIKTFDKVTLENHLDQLCAQLNIKIPDGQLAVQETQEAHVRRWNEMVANFMEKAQ